MKAKNNHRKLFVLSAIMLVGFMNLSAQTLTKTFTFNFDTEDFRLEQIGTERKCEFDMGLDYIYGELEEPALPHVPYDILLPDNYRVQSFTYSIGDDTRRFNRILFYPTEEDFMENNPDTLTVDSIPLYPTPGVTSSSYPGSTPPYPLQTFPAKVSHNGNHDRNGYRLESFTICPFIYHAVEQKLVLATSIELTVSIAPHNDATPSHNGTDDKWLKNHVYNPEDFGKGTENWAPASMDIAEEGKEWTIHSQVVYPYAPMITHKMRIEGDTIVNGETRKRLHCKTINEYGEERDVYEYCHQEGEIFYRNGVKMFDFGLQVGDTFHIDEYDEVLAVTEVSTIVLNDGVTRKCLSMGVWHSDSEDIPTQDKWIEGIGSLKMGIYDNSIMRTGVKDELQSVMSNDRCLYQKESKSEYPYMPVVIKGNPIPENPSTNDNIEFAIELGIFQGNETYKQQVDSVIGNTIYTSGTYNRYWPGAALFNQTKTMVLGMLEKGEYTLRHNIMALNGKALTGLDSTFVYTFTVMDANNIGSLTKQEFNVRTTASTLLCTSPDAIKLEVYTMDAVKVGEARFVGGEASVKVSKTPATYLYIVTYPDGRRESGKVVGKG